METKEPTQDCMEPGPEELTLADAMTRYQNALLRYAVCVMNNPAAAQDVVQEIFIRLHANLDKAARLGTELKLWLFRTAHDVSAEYIRKESCRRLLHPQRIKNAEWMAQGHEFRQVRNEQHASVLYNFYSLKPGERVVLLLRLQEGMSYREIASVIRRSERYAVRLIDTAVGRLSQRLQQGHPELYGSCRTKPEEQQATRDLLRAAIAAIPSPAYSVTWRKRRTDPRKISARAIWCAQVKAVLASGAIHIALFMLAGSLVIFTVVKKEEACFETPRVSLERPKLKLGRPKMKLKKPRVSVKVASRPKSTARVVTKSSGAIMSEMELPEMGGIGDGLSSGSGMACFGMTPDIKETVTLFGSAMSVEDYVDAAPDEPVDEYAFMDEVDEPQAAGQKETTDDISLFYEMFGSDLTIADADSNAQLNDSGRSGREDHSLPADQAESVFNGEMVILGCPLSPGEGLAAASGRQLDEGLVKKRRRDLKPAVFNPYIMSTDNAFSTFAIDVDTASYGLARQQLLAGGFPEPEQVRTEEFINSFDYDYRPPAGQQTFAIHSEMAPSPFRTGMELLKVGIKGRRIGRDNHRGAILTLVIDTSGSMATPERLGLIKESLTLLVDQLNPGDQMAIVQFGGEARLVLEHTSASERAQLLDAINALQSGGATQFDKGLELGYQLARDGFRAGHSNRIMILSDGVANLGEMDPEAILLQVADQRKKGIYLSVLGFGAGTYDDNLLERLANNGDGMYAYIDTLDEARRLLVDRLAATLHVIASDVKIQIEFNPERVLRYRQLGYENRQLTREQFRDDRVDAGEVGSGQSVTALYDVELKADLPGSGPIATVYVRYRREDNGAVEEISSRITDTSRVPRFEDADVRFRLAACTAEFAERLRRSPYSEDTRITDIADRLRSVARELDLGGQVEELRQLVSIVCRLES